MSGSVTDIRNSLGAGLFGLLISTTLFGVTIVQTWVYFWHYRNRDPKALKLWIIFITIMDALNASLRAYSIYWYLILNFGNVENMDYILWAMSIQVAIAAVVGASVQIYYARQVYVASRSIIFPILIVASVAIAFAFGFVLVAKEFTTKRFSKFHTFFWNPCVGLSAIALANLLIAAAMCWSFYRKRTGPAKPADSLIMILVAYGINSGLLTSLLATASLISFVVSPTSMIWLAFSWVTSGCAVNSLLALLNSRNYIRGQSSSSNLDNAFNLSSIRFEPQAGGAKSRETGTSGTSGTSATRRSSPLEFARSKSGHTTTTLEPTFEVPKPDTSHDTSTINISQSRTSISSAVGP